MTPIRYLISNKIYHILDNFIFDFSASQVIIQDLLYWPPIDEWIKKEYQIENVIISDNKWQDIIDNSYHIIPFMKFRIIDEYFFGDKISHKVDYNYATSQWYSYDIGIDYKTIMYKNGDKRIVKSQSIILPDDSQAILETRRLTIIYDIIYKIFLLRNTINIVMIESIFLSII